MREKFKMFLNLVAKANVPQNPGPEIPLFSRSDIDLWVLQVWYWHMDAIGCVFFSLPFQACFHILDVHQSQNPCLDCGHYGEVRWQETNVMNRIDRLCILNFSFVYTFHKYLYIAAWRKMVDRPCKIEWWCFDYIAIDLSARSAWLSHRPSISLLIQLLYIAYVLRNRKTRNQNAFFDPI
jgi:hypothetical protein